MVQIHKHGANRHNTSKYTKALQIHKMTTEFPEDSKKGWTRLGHVYCCHGLWLMKLFKLDPCIIHLCLCCGFPNSAASLLYCACVVSDCSMYIARPCRANKEYSISNLIDMWEDLVFLTEFNLYYPTTMINRHYYTGNIPR